MPLGSWKDPTDFVAALAAVRIANVFNPYTDHCHRHDLIDGPAIRRTNLELFLTAGLSAPIDEVWIGLELGQRGGRRTGLPLTDEMHLAALSDYWGVTGIRRATTGPPIAEDTASWVWKAVNSSAQRVFFWNAFPLQCHQVESTTNRNHSAAEAELLRPYLQWVLQRTAPSRVVALGLPAQRALKRAGIESRYVRHPARGGGKTFVESIGG